ncbi:MAG: hypothetical protein AAF654_09380 [Myxococcota bacterium]
MSRNAHVIALAAMLGGCASAWFGEEQPPKEPTRSSRANERRSLPAERPIVPIRVRVYVAKSYAKIQPDWEQAIAEQFDEANAILASAGARFDIEPPRVWGYDGAEKLEVDLSRLEEVAEATGADYVVGFIGALPRFSDSIQDLEFSRVLGRHAVVRAIDDQAELAAFRASVQSATPAEIDALYLKRRRHKQAVVLVQAWARTIGALREVGSADYLMQPTYDARRARFSAKNQRRVDLALRLRVGESGDEVAWRQALAAELARIPDGIEDAELLEMLRGGVVNERDRWQSLSLSERQELQQIFQLYNGGSYETAWSRLKPLRERHRDLGAIQTFACQTSLRAQRADATTVCGLAVLVAKFDPVPALELLAANSVHPALDTAELGLVKTACERRDGLRGHLAGFGARVLASYGAFSCAEDLVGLAAAESRTLLIRDLERERSRLGIPPSSTDAELEVRWWQDSQRINRMFRDKQLKEARTLAASSAERYPFSGPKAALCEAYARARRYRSARPHCEAALERYDKDSRALYVLSVLDLRGQRYDAAVSHLERALAARSNYEEAWRLLGQTLTQLGRSAELDALRARYRNELKRDPTF